ncbi:MAG: DUF1214 domain-containing protein [Acidobacteria bacterium]|nr:DUF1214 domain-containing protein [Acidobacteriota bacterium]
MAKRPHINPRGSNVSIEPVGALQRPSDMIAAVTEAWSSWAERIWLDLELDEDDSEQSRVDGLRFLNRYLSAGFTMALEADPAFPQFVRFADPTCSWGINNPDGNYLFAHFDPTGTYRIHGDPGTAHLLDFELHGPSFCEAPNYTKVGNLKREDLILDADGNMEIIVSPSEQPGTWLRTTPETGSQSMLVRQFFRDWAAERPASLSIERLDAPYPSPPLSFDDLRSRTDLLRRWLVHAGDFWHRMSRIGIDIGSNDMFFLTADDSEWGGHQGQAYGQGNFSMGENEAVIVQIEPPASDYWEIQLANRWWESLDWDRRQSSLNDHQMTLDDDGAFRGVISVADPGVANWLDPAGNQSGLIMGRFVNTAANPEPRLTVVPADRVMDHLPSTTPLVSADERTVALRARCVSAQRRQNP